MQFVLTLLLNHILATVNKHGPRRTTDPTCWCLHLFDFSSPPNRISIYFRWNQYWFSLIVRPFLGFALFSHFVYRVKPLHANTPSDGRKTKYYLFTNLWHSFFGTFVERCELYALQCEVLSCLFQFCSFAARPQPETNSSECWYRPPSSWSSIGAHYFEWINEWRNNKQDKRRSGFLRFLTT